MRFGNNVQIVVLYFYNFYMRSCIFTENVVSIAVMKTTATIKTQMQIMDNVLARREAQLTGYGLWHWL